MRTGKTMAVAAVTLVLALGLGITTARASIMVDPDYQARWDGVGQPWDIIVNDLGVDDPYWTDGGNDLNVYNIALAPPWHKQVILEATFGYSAPTPTPSDKDLELIYPGDVHFAWDQFLVEGNTWTVVWDLPSQDYGETVRFNGYPWGYGLWTSDAYNIDYVTVATKCIPEPTSLSLLALGGLAVLRRRR